MTQHLAAPTNDPSPECPRILWKLGIIGYFARGRKSVSSNLHIQSRLILNSSVFI